MAEDKKSFIMYADMLPTFEALKDAEAGKLIKHILRYVNDLNPETDNRVVAIAFEPIKQQMKRDLKSYEKTKARNKESGAMGNLKRWHPDLHQQVCDKKMTLQEATKIAVDRQTSPPDRPRSPLIAKIADNGNDTDNGNDKERESTAPSPENVKTELDEKTDTVPGIVPWPAAEKSTYQKTPAFAQTSADTATRPVHGRKSGEELAALIAKDPQKENATRIAMVKFMRARFPQSTDAHFEHLLIGFPGFFDVKFQDGGNLVNFQTAFDWYLQTFKNLPAINGTATKQKLGQGPDLSK